MKQTFFTSLCTLVILSSTSGFLHRPIDRLRRSSLVNSEEGVSKFLCYEYENRATDMCTKTVNAEWEHVVDIENKTKAEIAINATIESARLDYDIWINYFRDLDTSKFNSRNLARQVKRLSVLGHSALPEEKLAALTSLQYEMTEIYSTSKICPFANPKCNLLKEGLSYEPDIQNLMATSRDYDELLYTWVAWRETTGNRLKNKFEGYVQLSNEAAIANNFSDKGQMWKYEYESPDIEADLDRLWSEVAPLYKQLHTYVHAKLKVMYEKELESDNDHLIPAHLLGNMWGQTWIHLRDDVKPFPDVPDIDLTEIFAAKNVTVKKMFEMANEFYTSLGLPSMEMAFNTSKGAIIEKPKNKSILCHASAWDFCNGTDFRIKMCAKPTYQDFITIHHELGHIQYYLQYKHLPIAYRAGANPGFHEAIGAITQNRPSNPSPKMKLAVFGRPKQLLVGFKTNTYSTKRPTIRNPKECVANEKRSVEECGIIPSPDKTKFYSVGLLDALKDGPVVCAPAIEKAWNIPEDCPPPCPQEPSKNVPLKRLKKKYKLVKLACPSKKVCPPRADDDWNEPPKTLPCLPLSDCPQKEPDKMKSVNFTRMKKTEVFQRVVECAPLEKCDDVQLHVITRKNLPKIAPNDCPCVEPPKMTGESLKRLIPRPVAPKRAPEGPCPPPCDEEVKNFVKRKLLPCLKAKDCPVPPPPDLKCCPLRRLPKVHQHAQVPECKERPQCHSIIADEVCGYEPKTHRLPSMILCERHNKMSTKQYNMLKDLGQDPDARGGERAR